MIMRLPSDFDRHSRLRPTKSVSSSCFGWTRFLIKARNSERIRH